MSHPSTSKIFIIGGTGAQGLPISHALISSSTYTVRILTRDPTSPRSQSLRALGPQVELVTGSFTNEADLRRGYAGCDAAFVNIDGFNTGEKGEIFWAIRCYELAVQDGGIKFFVYGNLDYAYEQSGWDPKFRAGHYDGKGRVGEWILWQARDAAEKAGTGRGKAMGAALFTSGPYMEMCISKLTPMTPAVEQDEKGEDVLTWRLPLAEGAMAHVALDDCGYYVRWLFEHPERANGMDLKVAIEHSTYDEVAAAFTKVTGRPARFVDVDFDWYWREGNMSTRPDGSVAYSVDMDDPAAVTVRENFTGFWNIWRASGGNKGLVKRDYELLDEIHPKRIRSVEEWFEKEDRKGKEAGLGSLWDRVQPGKLGSILKLHDDGFKAPVPQTD